MLRRKFIVQGSFFSAGAKIFGEVGFYFQRKNKFLEKRDFIFSGRINFWRKRILTSGKK